MRTGFLVTLPEQLECFEPILRRSPGSSILVPQGLWPSPHLNSRDELLRLTRQRGLTPATEPQREFDLVVSHGELPESSLRAWLRDRGTLVQWRGPGDQGRLSWATLALLSGPRLHEDDPFSASEIVGDPQLDTALQVGARSRARSFLGLSTDLGRPLFVLRAEAQCGGLKTLAPALARLRLDADLVLSCSSLRRLDDPKPFDRVLSGPGILVAGEKIATADLLAAADLVLAEPGEFLLRAAALGRVSLGLGSWNLKRSLGGRGTPLDVALAEFEWVDDSDRLSRALAWAQEDPRALMVSASKVARGLLGPVDGNSVRRAVEALKLWGPQCGALEEQFS